MYLRNSGKKDFSCEWKSKFNFFFQPLRIADNIFPSLEIFFIHFKPGVQENARVITQKQDLIAKDFKKPAGGNTRKKTKRDK